MKHARSADFLFIAPLLILLLGGCQPPVNNDAQRDNTGSGDSPTSVTLPAGSRRDVQPVTVNYPESGVDLGWGWDSEEGVPRPSVCIEFSIAEDKGQTKYMTISEVSDSHELMQSMNISSAASIKTVAYKASGKASFAKNTKINSFGSNFVLNASVDNGVRYAAPLAEGGQGVVRNADDLQLVPDAGSIRLTKQALRLAQRPDLDGFLDTCGDSFVAALYGGANLTAVLTVVSTSRSEQSKTSASFTGSGWGAEVKMAASGDTGSKVKHDDLSMRFFQTGGRKDSIPASKEDFVAKLDDLSAQAAESPAIYRVSLLPYTALANWPARDIEISTDEQDQLSRYWGAYTAIYEDIDYILDQADKFRQLCTDKKFHKVDKSDLRLLQDEVHAVLLRLRDDALRCAEPDPEPAEVCVFDEGAYADPLAYRILLPVPGVPDADGASGCKGTEAAGEGASDDNVNEVIDYYVRDSSHSACRNNPVGSRCLSNEEITAWKNNLIPAMQAREQ